MAGNVKKIDGYEQFFDFVNKEKFFEFGLTNIISIDKEAASTEWRSLVKRIHNRDNNLYVRNFGRGGQSNGVLSKLYKEVLGIQINYDPTNNNRPAALIERLTDLKRNKTIFNYQVSHVFGRTKNVFCFTAPWNIVFIPKLLDPLTGHEAKGDFVKDFSKRFQSKVFETFKEQIKEANIEMDEVRKKVVDWFKFNRTDNRIESSIINEWKAIEI